MTLGWVWLQWVGLGMQGAWSDKALPPETGNSQDDEYKWAGLEPPKVMVTTSRDPSARLRLFAKVGVARFGCGPCGCG